MGNYYSALEDANQLIESDEMNPENWNLSGNIKLLFGDYDDAINDFDRAIRIRNDYAMCFYNRGLAYLMSGNTISGCNDIDLSIELGYEPARNIKINFCQK